MMRASGIWSLTAANARSEYTWNADLSRIQGSSAYLWKVGSGAIMAVPLGMSFSAFTTEVGISKKVSNRVAIKHFTETLATGRGSPHVIGYIGNGSSADEELRSASSMLAAVIA